MARALLDAPLTVLLHQAGDTLGHLEHMPPVREAIVALGFDLSAFEARLADAVARGWANDAQLGAARLRAQELTRSRTTQRGAISEWIVDLRRRLDLALLLETPAPPAVKVAVRAVRAQLTFDARRIAGTVDALRRTLPVLGAQQGVLSKSVSVEFVSTGQALLATVDALAVARTANETALVSAGEAAVASRVEVQAALREIREAWNLARSLQRSDGPALPKMPLEVLRDRQGGGRAEDRAAATRLRLAPSA